MEEPYQNSLSHKYFYAQMNFTFTAWLFNNLQYICWGWYVSMKKIKTRIFGKVKTMLWMEAFKSNRRPFISI